MSYALGVMQQTGPKIDGVYSRLTDVHGPLVQIIKLHQPIKPGKILIRRRRMVHSASAQLTVAVVGGDCVCVGRRGGGGGGEKTLVSSTTHIASIQKI